MAIIKGITGILGNSFALVADAIESTTDVFSSLIVLVGFKYSIKPPDDNHPYGHGKLEPLVTFAVVGFLLISATLIVYRSIENINTPHNPPENYTLAVLAVIIIVKEVFYRVVDKAGKEIGSTSVQADAWHHRSDAITSLMAFLGISVAVYFGEGYESADDWAALIAAFIIVFNAYLIFRPALGEIMDEHIHDDVIEEIRKVAAEVNGVIDTEKCFVRKAGIYYHVDLHLIVDGKISVRAGHDISHAVKNRLQGEMPQLRGILIHIEPS